MGKGSLKEHHDSWPTKESCSCTLYDDVVRYRPLERDFGSAKGNAMIDTVLYTIADHLILHEGVGGGLEITVRPAVRSFWPLTMA